MLVPFNRPSAENGSSTFSTRRGKVDREIHSVEGRDPRRFEIEIAGLFDIHNISRRGSHTRERSRVANELTGEKTESYSILRTATP